MNYEWAERDARSSITHLASLEERAQTSCLANARPNRSKGFP
jgi:hypothetical protein